MTTTKRRKKLKISTFLTLLIVLASVSKGQADIFTQSGGDAGPEVEIIRGWEGMNMNPDYFFMDVAWGKGCTDNMNELVGF